MRRPNMDALASAVIVLSLVALLLITGESVKLDGRRTRDTLAAVRTELDAANWLNNRLQRVALCALESRRPARCFQILDSRNGEVDETPGPEPGETDPPGVTGPEPSPEPTPPPPDETESPEPTDDPIDLPTPTISLPVPTPTIPPVVCDLLPILCN